MYSATSSRIGLPLITTVAYILRGKATESRIAWPSKGGEKTEVPTMLQDYWFLSKDRNVQCSQLPLNSQGNVTLEVEGHFTAFLINTRALHSTCNTTSFPAPLPWSHKTLAVKDFDNLPHDLPLSQPLNVSKGSVKAQYNFLLSYTITGDLLRRNLLMNWSIRIHCGPQRTPSASSQLLPICTYL